MINYLLFRCCILFFIPLSFSFTKFETAMEKGYETARYKVSNRFKKFYDQNHFSLKKKPIKPIPKTIHQIWIGGATIPVKAQKMMQSWKDKHPGWKYILWTDKEVSLLDLICKEQFLHAPNIGAKADILRYEILYRFGGVYVDVDFECVKALDPLVEAHSVFAGIAGFDYVGNAIIGVHEQCDLMKTALTKISFMDPKGLSMPWYQTGPYFFTPLIYQYLKKHPSEGVVYPTDYFHPLPNTYRTEFWEGRFSSEQINKLTTLDTFAIHYWMASWL